MGGTTPDVDPDELLKLHEPEASEQRLREMLERLPDAPEAWRACVRTRIARTYGLRGRFDEARAMLDEIEREGAPDDELSVRVLLERGRCANSSGDPDAARPLFERAWEQAGAAGLSALELDAAHMVAITLSGTPEGIAWAERALAIAEASDQPRVRRWMGPLLNNLGWDRFDLGQLDAALGLFERSLAFRREQGETGPIRIARWSVARCLRELGRPDEALAEQRALLDGAEGAQPDPGTIHEEIGECLLAIGREDEARPHLREAAERLAKDDWLCEHEPERIERLRSLIGGA